MEPTKNLRYMKVCDIEVKIQKENIAGILNLFWHIHGILKVLSHTQIFLTFFPSIDLDLSQMTMIQDQNKLSYQKQPLYQVFTEYLVEENTFKDLMHFPFLKHMAPMLG